MRVLMHECARVIVSRRGFADALRDGNFEPYGGLCAAATAEFVRINGIVQSVLVSARRAELILLACARTTTRRRWGVAQRALRRCDRADAVGWVSRVQDCEKSKLRYVRPCGFAARGCDRDAVFGVSLPVWGAAFALPVCMRVVVHCVCE